MITPQEFFNLLSDQTRLRCLLLLHMQKELCVCEFGDILGGIQPKISRHLSLLRRSGFVLDERRGQWVYYRLSPTIDPWMKKVLVFTLENLRYIDPYLTDLEKNKTLCNQRICNGEITPKNLVHFSKE